MTYRRNHDVTPNILISGWISHIRYLVIYKHIFFHNRTRELVRIIMQNMFAIPIYQFQIEFPGTSGVVYAEPNERSGHRVIIDGYNLYSFGGYNPIIGDEYNDNLWKTNDPQFSEIWKYNLISGQWIRLDSCCKHPGLLSPCLIKCGNLAVMFGGTKKQFHLESNNELSIYNLVKNSWLEKIETIGPKPEKYYGQGIINDRHNVYIIGGTEGYEYSLDVHVLNLYNKSWTFLKPNNLSGVEILPRYRHEIIKHGKFIYVIGGGTTFNVFSLAKIPTLNLDTLTWTITSTFKDQRTKNYPNRRKCHIALKYKNYIYVHGGIILKNNRPGNTEIPTNDLWRLNLNTLMWQEMKTSSNQCLFFHSGAITEEGCLYIFGGATPDGHRTNQIERIWLDVPSLKTMAFLTLDYYFPGLKEKDPSELLEIGIPLCLVEPLRQ